MYLRIKGNMWVHVYKYQEATREREMGFKVCYKFTSLLKNHLISENNHFLMLPSFKYREGWIGVEMPCHITLRLSI